MKYMNYETGELLDFEWKTPYNHDRDAVSRETGLECKDPTRTQQHQAEEANINSIVSRFLKTGLLPQIPLPPNLDEFGEIFDFQSAMNTLAEAKASFMQLPADIRSAFQNSPAHFVAQVDAMLGDQDPTRRDHNMKILRAMNLAVEPGPIADKTTLGDVLAAIKEQTAKGDSPAPEPS